MLCLSGYNIVLYTLSVSNPAWVHTLGSTISLQLLQPKA